MKKAIIFPFLIVLIGFSCLSAHAANNSLEFHGSDYVSVPYNSSLDLSSAMTIEFWVYLTDDGGKEVLSKGVSDASENFRIYIQQNADYIYFDYGDGLQYTATTSFTLNLTTWYHMAFTVSAGSKGHIYVNGVEASSYDTQADAPAEIPTNGQPMVIGGCTFLSRYFYGRHDELRIWNDIRTVEEIRQNMYRELPDPSSETNLAAYYKFNPTSGTSLPDSKNSNDGTLTNYGGETDYWQTSSAMFGPKNCLGFDGTDDYVGTSSAIDLGNEYTITFWMFADTLKDYGDPLSFGTSDFHLTFVTYADGHMYYSSGNGTAWGNGITTDAGTFSTGKWYHISGVSTGTKLQLYIDGIPIAESDSNSNSINEVLIIGSRNGSEHFFDGMIDDVHIWSSALSATQLRENMCKNLNGNESGLLAYYSFDNASGTKLQDFSGNEYDGTWHGSGGGDYTSPEWTSSAAYNTWLNTSSSDWSAVVSNWSLGSKPAMESVGIYGYTGGSAPTFDNGDEAGGGNVVVKLSSGWSIGGYFSVAGNLILESNLDLNGQTIDLGSSGYLIEDAGRLDGTNGHITTTRSLSFPDAEDVAGLGAVISADHDLGSTTISRGMAEVALPGGARSILRSFAITPTNNSGLNATLDFLYDESELNEVTESSLKLYKNETGTYVLQSSSAVNVSDNYVRQSSIDSFSTWTAGGTPTLVVLVSFTAEPCSAPDTCIRVAWETAAEIDNAGFYVQRAEAEGGPYERVTGMIPAEGGHALGWTYEVEDANVIPLATYFYRLEDVDVRGVCTLHGPASAAAPLPEGAWRTARPASTVDGAKPRASGVVNILLCLTLPALALGLVLRSRRSRKTRGRG